MNICITNPNELQRHMENLSWLTAKEDDDIVITAQAKTTQKSWEQRPKRKSKSQITAEKQAELMAKIKKSAQASLQLATSMPKNWHKTALLKTKI